MPTTLTQLSADRQLTALRRPLPCEGTATVLRQGPATEPGGAPAWLLFLCSEHSENLPDWPGTVADTADRLTLSCGAALDYRTTEQVLQPHADLWLTPMTGVDPATYDDGWHEILHRAHRVLAERPAEAGGKGETLHSLTMMLGIAAEYAEGDDLYQATVPLGYCETLSRNL
ncbi:hypothetical protein OIU91_40780 [Streptomyces sp. NBC_01456]|uniref:hypothetical protein n=1 Tax=unclassified Streptomyces TaxID=2593676 RepID=UPI002E31D470|nr:MULTISPECIES: hypothetical protein [unclassified Streptomyces]